MTITMTLIAAEKDARRAATHDGNCDGNKNGDCRRVTASIVAIPTTQWSPT